MEARVKLVRSGDRTRTSCTHERTCVGATNALTNWASQTNRGWWVTGLALMRWRTHRPTAFQIRGSTAPQPTGSYNQTAHRDYADNSRKSPQTENSASIKYSDLLISEVWSEGERTPSVSTLLKNRAMWAYALIAAFSRKLETIINYKTTYDITIQKSRDFRIG